jgi:hypothetical protein
LVATQNILSPEQIPLGMSLVAFSQSFGGSMFLAIAQTLFNYSLTEGLRTLAPSVDATTVIQAGASGFRDVVRPEELRGVREAYNLSFTREFDLAAVTYAVMFFSAWAMGWYSVKKKEILNRNTTA